MRGGSVLATDVNVQLLRKDAISPLSKVCNQILNIRNKSLEMGKSGSKSFLLVNDKHPQLQRKL